MNLESLSVQADTLRNNGDTEGALLVYAELLPRALASSEFRLAGHALHMSGVCYKMQDATDLALEALQKAADFFRHYHFHSAAANVLRDIGTTFEYAGRYQEAIPPLEQAVAHLRSSPDQSGYAITLAKLGLVFTFMENYSEAASNLDAAERILSSLYDSDPSPNGPWFFYITTVFHGAQLLAAQGSYEPAFQKLYGGNLILHHLGGEGFAWRKLEFRGLLANCSAHAGSLDVSRDYYQAVVDAMGDPKLAPGSLAHLRRQIRADETEQLLRA